MSFPPSNLSQFHNDVFRDTELGQLCGTKQLFRDRYLVLRMLGRGGFGVTFLARDLRLPAKPFCVIKQLCPRVSEAKALETARRRFQREAKTLAALGSHSQIPCLLDYFVVGEDFYLVQEYIRGATLARLVRRQGCQSEVIVKRILRETLLLLDYVHQQGVIHRDVKPQNIILAQDRRLVLIDFGAVKQELMQIDNSSKGVTTHFVGTVGFAPPEQFALRPVYASDIYALGVTCLYLLTGKAPLDFKSDRATGELKWQDRIELSRPFARILEKILKPSLAERYQSVQEVLRDLERMSPQNDLNQCMNAQVTPRKTPQDSPTPPRSEKARLAEAIRDWNKRHNQERLIHSSN
ncbi:serine/threonine-protein kinase [Spirulina subsalsa]|uniref:serine/threonine-protein kinase n=1 Tax=Spirulina subsalsa TaxID=54311 RepID=UPI0002DD66CA|nr:serine/threonine-protein kinase [Spirulina subsalsa]